MPSQPGTQSRMFCTKSRSTKASRTVILRTPQSVSCTMPMTGYRTRAGSASFVNMESYASLCTLFDCGETICLGTQAI